MSITNTTLPSSSYPAPACRPVIARYTSNANVAQVETVTLTGSSGTCAVSVTGNDGVLNTYTATFSTNLNTTATNFDSTHSAALTAVGITLTHSGADVIFTSVTPGVPFSVDAPSNISGNLSGSLAHTTANVTLVHLIALPVIDSVEYPPQVLDLTPDTDFVFDISSRIQNRFITKSRTNNYTLPSLPATSTVTDNSAGMLCNYVIKTYEVTGTEVPYTETYPATPQNTTGTRYALFCARQHTDTQTLAAYVAGSSASKFLTNQPSSKTVHLNETSYLTIYSDTSLTYGAKLTTYDAAGTPTASTLTSAAIGANKVILIAVGPDNINRRTPGTITSSVAYYTIQLINTTGPVVMSETKTFIVDNGPKPFSKTFHWVNPFGGIDSYTFTYDWKRKQNVQTKTFQKFLPYSFNTNDRGSAIMDISASESFEVSSNFISQAECDWVSEIKKSPSVWLESGTNYVPVILRPGESIIEDSNVLPQVKIEYSLANVINTQRG